MQQLQPQNKKKVNWVVPVIILIVVFLIIVLLFAIPFGIIFFKAKSQCGSGGMIVGSMNKGYYCVYSSVCESCQNYSGCPECSGLCEGKGKVEREGYCGPGSIDLTNKIKRYPNGSWYADMGPIQCYCCCDEIE